MPVIYDFHKQVAIVTGGSRGIGGSIAERLRDAGAKVFVWDLHEPGFDGVVFAEVDVSDASSIERGLSLVTATCEKVDILVNNAGFVGSATSVLEFDPREWRRSVEVNLLRFYVVCRYVVPLMKRSGYGVLSTWPRLPAGRTVQVRILRCKGRRNRIYQIVWQRAFANSNIRVNAIAPGAISPEILLQLSCWTSAYVTFATDCAVL